MDTSIFEELGITEEDAPKGADLKAIADAAKTMRDVETRISHMNDTLKTLQREHLSAMQAVITLMESAGMKNFTLTDGKRVEIKQELYASLPKEASRRKDVLTKMRDVYGADSLIKQEMVIELGKGAGNSAAVLEAQAKEMGLDVERTENVHSQTYKKFINDRLKKGQEIDLSFFGAYQETKAIIKE